MATGLGNPLDIHEMPPARFSTSTATTAVRGHLFRVHASRMLVLFLIREAQIQKYIATLKNGNEKGCWWYGAETRLDWVSGSRRSRLQRHLVRHAAKCRGRTACALVSRSPTIYPSCTLTDVHIGSEDTVLQCLGAKFSPCNEQPNPCYCLTPCEQVKETPDTYGYSLREKERG